MSKPTLQYEEVAAQELVPVPEPTAISAQLSYDDAKPYLSGKPLRRPSRPRVLSQDHTDAAEAIRRRDNDQQIESTLPRFHPAPSMVNSRLVALQETP